MKKISFFLSFIFLSLLLIACKPSTPSDVVDNYYTSLTKGDFEKALTYTTANDEEVKKQVEKMNGLEVKIPKYEILSEEVSEDGESAMVEVKYTFTSAFNAEPEETTNQEKLVQVDGEWKID